jgi:hypothetical protein
MKINTLHQLIDEAKLELYPLEAHMLSSQSEWDREQYAILLAAVLIGDGTVSEAQCRVFALLLAALHLPTEPARYFALVGQIDKSTVIEFVNRYKSQDVAKAFIFDAAVLEKLSEKSSLESKQFLFEIIQLLDVNFNEQVFFYKLLFSGKPKNDIKHRIVLKQDIYKIITINGSFLTAFLSKHSSCYSSEGIHIALKIRTNTLIYNEETENLGVIHWGDTKFDSLKVKVRYGIEYLNYLRHWKPVFQDVIEGNCA